MHVRLGLVSAPGSIRDATCATIAMMPDVRLVALMSGALSATRLLPHIQLDHILLDANLPEEEVSALLTWLAEHLPAVRKVVTRTTSAECDQARAFGADEAFRRDELAPKLALFIDEMSG
jgi:DNA-binding NarL/FixJ family response regulator